MCLSKLLLPYLRLLLLQVFFMLSSTIPQGQTFDLCVEKEKPDFNLTLLGANRFDDHIMLTTRSMGDDGKPIYTVYTVPFGDFENSYGQMLISVKGVPLEKYWRGFELNNTKWGPIADKVITLWLANMVKPIMYFFVPGWQPIPSYDVQAGNWTNQTLYWNISADAVLTYITDGKHHVYHTDTYYDPNNSTLGWVNWIVWDQHYTPDGLEGDSPMDYNSMMYYLRDKTDPSFLNLSIIRGHEMSYKEITDPANDPYAKVDKGQYYLDHTSDWTSDAYFQPPGFIHKGQVYVFDRKKVFIFDDGWQHSDHFLPRYSIMFSSSIKAILIKDFFHCDSAAASWNNPDDPDNERNGKSSGLRAWVIAVIVVVGVLLLLLAIFLLVMFTKKSSKKDKKGNNNNNKGGSSKATSKKGSSRKGSSAQQKKRGASKVGAVGGASASRVSTRAMTKKRSRKQQQQQLGRH